MIGTVRRIWLWGQLLIVGSTLWFAMRGAMRVADILLIVGALGQMVWLRWLRPAPADQKSERDVRLLR